MKLFTTEQVKRYFDVLGRMGRTTCNRYSDGNFASCEKEVFVRRTLDKWLRGKYVILYTESEQFQFEYKRYLYISRVSYALTWGEVISVGIVDFSRPVDVFKSLSFGHNEALDAEGEWIEDPENYHNALLNLTALSIPEREFVFKAYDTTKISEKKNKKEYLETTVSVNAMTEREAYRKKKQLQEKNHELWICPDILEIKDIKV